MSNRASAAFLAEILLVGLILGLLGGRLVTGDGPEITLDRSDVTLRLDVNRATWAELMCLPGIGEVRAREIVRDRRERGPFAGPEDLDRVPGIGPVTVERVREFLRD